MQILSYVFCGFACNAKSAMVDIVEGFIPKEAIPVVVKDKTRSCIKTANMLGNNSNGVVECAAISSELNIGKLLKSISIGIENIRSDSVLVYLSDRSPFDALAYSCAYGFVDTDDVFRFIVDYINDIYVNKIFVIGKIEDRDFIETHCLSDSCRDTVFSNADKFLELQDKYYDALHKILHSRLRFVSTIDLPHPYYNSLTPMKVASIIRKDIKYVLDSNGGLAL